MKSIPVLSRDSKPHNSSNSDESASSASDCFTTSSFVSSSSNSSINSAVSRSYSSTATDRKNRLVPPPASGSPEWYIKKIHEQTVSSKQLTALQAFLQGKDVDWIRRFVELGGMSALARWLFLSNRKVSDAGVEFEVVKCLTHILNHRSSTIIALAEGADSIIVHIASALDTPHLPTRRLLLDILVFLVYWDDGTNYRTVINGLESLSEDNDKAKNAYAFWFASLQAVLSGRGKMGSRVGVSEQLKWNKGHPEALLTEYLLSNILLMNGIVQVIDDLDVRLHHRAQMESSGLQTIIKQVRDCNIAVIDTQLDLFQQTLEEDQRSLEDRMHKIDSCDMTNIDEVYSALRAKTRDSEKAEAYFLSIFQHLLLIRQEGPELVHFLQVLDSVVADVVMDKKLQGAEKRLGLSVERIVGQLEQAELAKEVKEELVKTRTAALHLKIEKEALEDRIVHADRLVVTLQSEVSKLRLESAKLSGVEGNTVTCPTNSSYANRLAQLADVLPVSPLNLSYTPTNTPRATPRKTSVPGRQAFWGISSWFNGSREDESGPGSGSSVSTSTSIRVDSMSPLSMPPASKTGLGITEMKEDLIVTTNIGEKSAAV
ncbi:armadillo-type protein [Irpex rosettiformis]|uniref:Armadillo-type protein n=1 Tax=Irpex rosettiformis TaxID=378272 RepID=A0ACB8UIZ6_9APHY|nr:armadillo-type protein [Irpex rosettiformis]